MEFKADAMNADHEGLKSANEQMLRHGQSPGSRVDGYCWCPVLGGEAYLSPEPGICQMDALLARREAKGTKRACIAWEEEMQGGVSPYVTSRVRDLGLSFRFITMDSFIAPHGLLHLLCRDNNHTQDQPTASGRLDDNAT